MFFTPKFRFMDQNTGDNAGGGGGDGNQGNQGDNNQEDGNNSPFSLSPFAAPATIDNGTGGGNQGQNVGNQGQPNNQGNQGQPANQQPNASQQMAQFIDSLDLTAGIDVNAVQNSITNNENIGENLNTAFKTVAANVFQQTMVHANRLMDKRIEKAVNEAVSKSGDNTRNDFAWASLKEQMEMVDRPEIKPIAKQVLDGFLTKDGSTVQDAVKNTVKYFQESVATMGQHFNMIPNSPPGSRPFGQGGMPPNNQQNQNQNAMNQDATDFMELLSGTPSQS